MPMHKRRSTVGLKKQSQSLSLRILIFCVVSSLTLFAFSVREQATGPFSIARSVVGTLCIPIHYAGSLVTFPFRVAATAFSNAGASSETLSELKQENATLSARVSELEEAKKTTDRLQDLLALKSTYNLQSCAARIISGSHSSWEDCVTIDKGSTSGLSVGMPVMDSNGAIGQIIECNATSSVVRLLSDEKSSIPAMIQSSRAQGVVQGSVDGTIRLTLINSNLKAEVGDIVLTSGLGGIFPKGVPLGKITTVDKVSGSLYYSIHIAKLSPTENLEEVLVVTSLTEEQKATDKDISEADAQDSVANQDLTSVKSDDSASSSSKASSSKSSSSAKSSSSTSDSSADSTKKEE